MKSLEQGLGVRGPGSLKYSQYQHQGGTPNRALSFCLCKSALPLVMEMQGTALAVGSTTRMAALAKLGTIGPIVSDFGPRICYALLSPNPAPLTVATSISCS